MVDLHYPDNSERPFCVSSSETEVRDEIKKAKKHTWLRIAAEMIIGDFKVVT